MRTSSIAALLCLCFCAALLHAAPVGAAPAPTLDACSLLRADEISKAVGAPVEGGRPQEVDAGQDGDVSAVCLWLIPESADSTSDPSAPLRGRSFVILNVHQWPPRSARARAFLDAFRDAAERGDIPRKTEARNFGDEALWWGDGLAVRQGDVSFGLSIFTPRLPQASNGEREERLAPLILKRLAAARHATGSAQ